MNAHLTNAGLPADSPAAVPIIALIGFMGAGKSTVGRKLARRLHRRFVDLDELIRDRTGRSPAELFASGGEPLFRRAEREALWSLVGEQGLVLATGGGTPMEPENRPFFTGPARTFYLHVSWEGFRQRTSDKGGRPLLQKPEGELQALYSARLAVYRLLGEPVETDGRCPGEVVADIMASVHQRGRSEPSGPAGKSSGSGEPSSSS